MADVAELEGKNKRARTEDEEEKYEHKMAELVEKYEHKIEVLRTELEEKYERKMADLRATLEEKRAALEETRIRELAEREETRIRELAEREETRKQELAEREETRIRELAEREETRKRELAEREETRKRELAELRAELEEKHERKMAEREEKHKEELAKWQSKIDTQTNGIHRMTEAILQVGNGFVREFKELRGGAKKTIEAQSLALDAAKRQAEVTRSRMNDLLVSMSKQSTMRLDGKMRGFALVSKSSSDRKDVVCVTGFEEDVKSKVSTLAARDYKVESEFEANANPDDFLDNVKERGTKMVKQRIQEHNDNLRDKDANASDLIDSDEPPVSFKNPSHVTIQLDQNVVSFSNPELASQVLDFKNIITLEDVLEVYARVQKITTMPPAYYEQMLGDDNSEDQITIIELARPVEDILYTQLQDIVDAIRNLRITDAVESS